MTKRKRIEKTKKESIGILLIAIGNKYYADRAYTMAVSLKSHTEDLSVSVVTYGNSLDHLSLEEQKIFDNKILVKENHINGIRGFDVFKPKICLDELTPYDKTLYFDVDTIWNNDHSITQFLYSFQGIGFTSGNRGKLSTVDAALRSQWTDLSKIAEMYKLQYVYDVSSEVIYFEAGTKVFEKAREVYDNTRIEVKPFGNGYPDEVWLMIAIELLKVKLHESPFQPSYWQPLYFHDKKKVFTEKEIRDFKLLSLGGAFTAENVRRLYTTMASASFYRMGLDFHSRFPDRGGAIYLVESKSQVLTERRFI